MRWIPAVLPALALAALGAVGCEGTAPGESAFDWELTPDRAETTTNSAVFFHIKINSKNNINSDLELTATEPSGFQVLLVETLASTADEADGEIIVPAEADPGTYSIEVSVREEGGAWHSKTILVIVSDSDAGEPDFSVELDPAEFTMQVEVGKTFTYYIRPLHGFLGTVDITLSELPDDLVFGQQISRPQISFTNSGGQGGTFVLSYQPHPPVSSPVQLILTVSGGGITHTRTLTLTLPPLPS